MPRKKKVLAENPPVVEKSLDSVEWKGGYASKCGHVNKQHYNAKGRLEDLVCDREPGHDGDHHAICFRNVAEHVYNNKGVVVEEHYNQVEADSYWGNGAGVPAKDIKAGEAPQFSQFQRDLVAAILKTDPEMSAEEAYAKAKASPVWTAGNV